jgi:hypothetical protein
VSSGDARQPATASGLERRGGSLICIAASPMQRPWAVG